MKRQICYILFLQKPGQCWQDKYAECQNILNQRNLEKLQSLVSAREPKWDVDQTFYNYHVQPPSKPNGNSFTCRDILRPLHMHTAENWYEGVEILIKAGASLDYFEFKVCMICIWSNLTFVFGVVPKCIKQDSW